MVGVSAGRAPGPDCRASGAAAGRLGSSLGAGAPTMSRQAAPSAHRHRGYGPGGDSRSEPGGHGPRRPAAGSRPPPCAAGCRSRPAAPPSVHRRRCVPARPCNGRRRRTSQPRPGDPSRRAQVVRPVATGSGPLGGTLYAPPLRSQSECSALPVWLAQDVSPLRLRPHSPKRPGADRRPRDFGAKKRSLGPRPRLSGSNRGPASSPHHCLSPETR